jgi:hypothetical protein
MSNWQTAAGVALSICLAASSQAKAQDKNATGPKPMELTALDYIQIQQLVAKYSLYIDTCSNNGYDYADLFAEDGFFAPFQNGQVGKKSQGPRRSRRCRAVAPKAARARAGSDRACITFTSTTSSTRRPKARRVRSTC